MTPDSIKAFTEYLEKAFNLAILMVESGSVIITVQCPNLESLESLWNDYQSGHLNDIAETFLVTDELKRKLGMQNIRLKTTIEEENYYFITHPAHERLYHTSGVYAPYSLRTAVWVLLRLSRIKTLKEL